MSSFVQRQVDAAVASPILPVRFRAAAMRRLGYQVGAQTDIHAGAHLGSHRISFGEGVYVNVGLYFDGLAPVSVGDRVALGPCVRLITAAHDIGGAEHRSTSEATPRPIDIGHGCWVAAGATILPGATIGTGCVIAAGAVVTGDTEPNGLYAGVPAKRLRDLPA